MELNQRGGFYYFFGFNLLCIMKSNLLSYFGTFFGIILVSSTLNGQNVAKSYTSFSVINYTVQKNDNVFRIAERFKVTTDSVRYWNNLSNDLLAVGTKLSIHDYSVAAIESNEQRTRGNAAHTDQPMYVKKGTIHCITIGVTEHNDVGNIPELVFTRNDAIDLRNMFQAQKGQLYENVSAHAIVTEPVRDTILESLSSVAAQASDSDVIMVFISAHAQIDRNNVLCMIPKDYDFYEGKNSLVLLDILRMLYDVKCPKIIVLDVCNAEQAAPNLLDVLNNLGSDFTQKVAIVVGTAAYQDAEEASKWKHGALTQVILDGLQKGEADSQHGDGIITIPELAAYVANQVAHITNKKQDASMPINFVGNLPIYKYRKANTASIKPNPNSPINKTN